MLAAMLTVGLAGTAWSESPLSERPQPASGLINEELELLKEEETVSIASGYEQPISQAPSNVYVITDEDIRQSGADEPGRATRGGLADRAAVFSTGQTGSKTALSPIIRARQPSGFR